MSEQYGKGVKEFIDFAVEHASDPTRISCPCLRCWFGKRISPRDLEDHLVCNGIDVDFPEFGEELRNLRLLLATDGMNPYGLQSSSHSTWPVILMIYNIPRSRCMK